MRHLAAIAVGRIQRRAHRCPTHQLEVLGLRVVQAILFDEQALRIVRFEAAGIERYPVGFFGASIRAYGDDRATYQGHVRQGENNISVVPVAGRDKVSSSSPSGSRARPSHRQAGTGYRPARVRVRPPRNPRRRAYSASVMLIPSKNTCTPFSTVKRALASSWKWLWTKRYSSGSPPSSSR